MTDSTLLDDCQNIVATEPDNATARFDLARSYHQAGRDGEAIIQASEALTRDPGLHAAARLLGFLLAHVRLKNPAGMNPVGLTAAFNFSDVDHQVLSLRAFEYLRQCTPFGEAVLLGGVRGWQAGVELLLSSKGRAILRHPLLLKALRAAANTDVNIEHLLRAFRKHLLMTPTKQTLRKGPVFEFTCALARQMEINEYIIAVSAEERRRLEEIFINIDGLKSGSRAAADSLLLKSLYAPIDQWLETDHGLGASTLTPKALGDLVTARLTERDTETSAARDIPVLGRIEDRVSASVAQLYEENPYPRWLSLHQPGPESRRRQLTDFFLAVDLAFMDQPYRVLIAGAGTGQQAIDAASGYAPMGDVTAIDISRASLGYAKKMASRYQVENLHFLQCDILNVDLLETTFDVIECIGVLHHMDDPWLGWKKLLEKLRPGGLLKIALYSKAARRDIALLREAIIAQGRGDDDDAIRTYRQGILEEIDGGKGAFLIESSDFYTLSNFRDLMFHVSEQHMTLPEIDSFLRSNELTFKGFQLPMELAAGSPQGEEAGNLALWHTFEQAHPDTFKGMYVFWCRKNPD